jgi:hypothetical protein
MIEGNIMKSDDIMITPHPAWAQVLDQKNVDQAISFVINQLSDVVNSNYADHTEDDYSTFGRVGITLSTLNRMPEILKILDQINKNPNFEDDVLNDLIFPIHDNPLTDEGPNIITHTIETPFSRPAKALAAFLLIDLAKQLTQIASEITYMDQGYS